MKRSLCLFAVLTLTGCTSTPGEQSTKPTPAKGTPAASEGKEAKIQAALAKLEPEDRKAAEAQRWCAISKGSRLGAMGTPKKLMIQGQPVFLCCDGCQEEAEAHPEKALANVKELKQKAAKAP